MTCIPRDATPLAPQLLSHCPRAWRLLCSTAAIPARLHETPFTTDKIHWDGPRTGRAERAHSGGVGYLGLAILCRHFFRYSW